MAQRKGLYTLKMTRVMWLKLILAIPIWRSKRTIQSEEKALEQDISATQLRAQSGKLVTGRVKCGKK
jgi:hypothetical protein